MAWVRRLLLSGAVLLASGLPTQAGLQLVFDYTYDSRGFFNDPARRESLEAAGRLINRYVDNLEAINPTPPVNTWSSFFSPPDERPAIILSNLAVPADTMQIFVGGAKIAGRLAQAIDTAPVGFGTDAWEDTVHYRGQTGAKATPATDVGPMGGTITFNDDPTEFQWHFDLSTAGLSSTEFDFITVAAHELMHLLGIGISESWYDHVNGSNQFIGSDSKAVGSPTNATLSLDAGEAHWRSGTRSTWNGKVQEALLAPGIFPGRRAYPTLLDRAALRDLGWEEASAGDATLDRKFDSADLLAVFQSGRYETGVFSGWSDGDWNDDAIFDSSDLIQALQTGTYEQSGEAALSSLATLPAISAVQVLYDPTTGRVTVNTEGDKLTTLQLTTEELSFYQSSSTPFGGPFDIIRDDKLFVMDVTGFSEISFEQLLPPDRSIAELQSLIDIDGSWLKGGAPDQIEWLVVPEPSALYALLMLLPLSLLDRVRRHPVR